ncbi:amidase family protein [Bordetella holmesii 44057]|nr:amidase family protein [Bordetella holmesii 44057]
MSWQSLCEMTAVQMRAQIAAGQLSAREVTDAHLAAIGQRNPAVNAIVTLDEQAAREQAQAADDAQARGRSLACCMGCLWRIKTVF